MTRRARLRVALWIVNLEHRLTHPPERADGVTFAGWLIVITLLWLLAHPPRWGQ